MPLVAHLAARPDPGRPVHDQPVAGAAVVGGDLLRPLVRRVHRDRPTRGVVGVGVRAAEVPGAVGDEPGYPLGAVADPVEAQCLVEGALETALGRGAVVAEDVEHDGVVQVAALAQRLDQPADLGVGVLGERGVQLHEPLRVVPREIVDVVPVRHARRPRRRLGVVRNEAQLLLPFEGEVALFVPSMGELAAVAVPPPFGHLERRVRGAEREVAEPRLAAAVRAHLPGPRDRPVGQVLGQVVALGGRGRRVDERGAVDEGGLELAGLAAQEAVEPVKALVGRPPVERTRGGLFPRRGLVPFAERGGRVAVALQDLRERSGGARPHAVVPGCAGRDLHDSADPDRVVVAAGHQCRPGR